MSPEKKFLLENIKQITALSKRHTSHTLQFKGKQLPLVRQVICLGVTSVCCRGRKRKRLKTLLLSLWPPTLNPLLNLSFLCWLPCSKINFKLSFPKAALTMLSDWFLYLFLHQMQLNTFSLWNICTPLLWLVNFYQLPNIYNVPGKWDSLSILVAPCSPVLNGGVGVGRWNTLFPLKANANHSKGLLSRTSTLLTTVTDCQLWHFRPSPSLTPTIGFWSNLPFEFKVVSVKITLVSPAPVWYAQTTSGVLRAF